MAHQADGLILAASRPNADGIDGSADSRQASALLPFTNREDAPSTFLRSSSALVHTAGEDREAQRSSGCETRMTCIYDSSFRFADDRISHDGIELSLEPNPTLLL